MQDNLYLSADWSPEKIALLFYAEQTKQLGFELVGSG